MNKVLFDLRRGVLYSNGMFDTNAALDIIDEIIDLFEGDDETRTYNCCGLPVDLTLPEGEHDDWLFQTQIENINRGFLNAAYYDKNGILWGNGAW